MENPNKEEIIALLKQMQTYAKLIDTRSARLQIELYRPSFQYNSQKNWFDNDLAQIEKVLQDLEELLTKLKPAK
jgi:hypothetical protein